MTGRPILVDFNEGAAYVVGERLEVSERRQLSIAEIISRHQQAQLAQDVRCPSTTPPSARMRQYFSPDDRRPWVRRGDREPLFCRRAGGGVGGTVVLGQRVQVGIGPARRFRSCSRRRCFRCRCSCDSTRGTPTPSRGVERVDGFDCYVVQFSPARRDSALYRGTVWIDQRTFARIRCRQCRAASPLPSCPTEETLHVRAM